MEAATDPRPDRSVELAAELEKVRRERDSARAEVNLLKKDLEQSRTETVKVLSSVKYTLRSTLAENIRLKRALAERDVR